MRRVILTTAFIAAVGLIPASAVAAGNPSGTGQPNQSCQAVFGFPDSAPPPEFPSPNGFNTGTSSTMGGPAGTGFANATGKYAGSGFAGSTSNNPNAQSNPNAVSQYDVACYQTSQQH